MSLPKLCVNKYTIGILECPIRCTGIGMVSHFAKRLTDRFKCFECACTHKYYSRSFRVVILMVCLFINVDGYSQQLSELCMPLDSAMMYLTQNSNQSISYTLPASNYKTKVCFKQNQSLEHQLYQIAQDRSLIYERIGNGYAITIVDLLHIYGQLRDADTQSPLAGVAVYIPAMFKGIYSDENGFYRLTVNNAEQIILETSYLGYEGFRKTISARDETRVDIQLQIDNILPEVLIDENNQDTSLNVSGDISSHIPLHKLYHLPSFVGTSDIMRHLSTDAGISLGSDAVSQLRVRGGDVDQNLILLDGIPVFHPTHSLGFISIFNTSIIQQADFYQADFSTRYTGRLSSVLDVKTKNGDMNTLHGEANVGLLGAGIQLNGPILKNKLSFIVEARRSIGTHFVDDRTFDNSRDASDFGSMDREVNNSLKFQEVFLKLNVALSNHSDLQAGYYYGADLFESLERNTYTDDYDYYFDTEDNYQYEYGWGNTLAYLNWNQFLFNKAFLNVKLFTSQYRYQAPFANVSGFTDDFKDTEINKIESRFHQTGLHVSSAFEPMRDHRFDLGFQFNRNLYVPGESNFEFQEGVDNSDLQGLFEDSKALEVDTFRQHATLLSAHLEHTYSPSESWIIKYGAVISGSSLDDSLSGNFWDVQPRLSISYVPSKSVRLKLSAGRMAQYQHALSPAQSGLSNRLTVPAQGRFGPEYSDQVSLSVGLKQLYGLDIDLSVYFKSQKNIIRYRFDAPLSTIGPLNNVQAFEWQRDVTSGSRKHAGLEVGVSKKIWNGRLSTTYNFGRSVQKYAEYIDNLDHPSFLHRNHQGIISILYPLWNNFSVNLNWQYGSANKITLPPEEYVLTDSRSSETQEINSNEPLELILDPYHRMDLAINYFKAMPKMTHRVKLGLFNVYNRYNFYYNNFFSLVDDYGDPVGYEVRRQYRAAFIPSIQYSVSF